MVWKFDFSSSGLVVDTVQAKVEAIRAPNGHVLMSIRNEQDEENEQELEEGKNEAVLPIVDKSEF